MGELFEISPAQRRHMQEVSAGLIAANPSKYLTGPYRVAPPPPPPPKPVEFVPPAGAKPIEIARALLMFHAGIKPALVATIKAHAKKLGISLATLKRAKKVAGFSTIER
jgi:hypothetical protein